MPGQEEARCPADPVCVVNTLRTCSDAGVPVEIPCGEARCAADAPVPRCVPAAALPCETTDDAPRCLNGRIIECDEAAGYRLAHSCGAGEVCVGEGRLARCDLARRVVCTQNRWSPLCIDDELFTCGDDGRVAVSAGCDR